MKKALSFFQFCQFIFAHPYSVSFELANLLIPKTPLERLYGALKQQGRRPEQKWQGRLSVHGAFRLI